MHPVSSPTHPSVPPRRVGPPWLAAAMLLAGTATRLEAATYYVSPSGNDSNSGTSTGSPWGTLTKASSTPVAGDIVVLMPGTHNGDLDPRNSGTAGARITYVGSLANPSSVVVPSITCTKDFITLKGMKTSGTTLFDSPARRDSLAFSEIKSLYIYGTKYSMFARNQISGTVALMLNGGGATGGTTNCEQDTMRRNTIDMGSIPPTHGFKVRGFTAQCLFDSNRVTGLFDNSTVDGVGRILYNSNNNLMRDNWWKFEANTSRGGQAWNGIVMRDSANSWTFERDTLLLGTQSSFEVLAMMDGEGIWPNTVRNNHWDHCLYKTNSSFMSENQFVGSTIDYSVFASSGQLGMWFLGMYSGAKIRHSTIYADKQALRFEGGIDTNSGAELTSNIIYSRSADPLANYGAQTRYGSSVGPGFVQNNNLFFTPTYSSSPGDLSLMWCCYASSKPGTGTPWFNLTGNDASSRYGSPLFQDSTFATFDGHVRAGSKAIGIGVGGTDAGAFPFVPAGPDLTPPAAVVDLAAPMVADNNLILTWTAPGDDGVLGLASAYDLRWSTQPIDAGSFNAATPVSVQPVPAAPGTLQTYVIRSLTPGTDYYFVLKTRDEANNWSAMSNALTATTTATDQTRPASINDLRTGP